MNKLVQEARALCEGATEGPWTASLCEWDCDCENFYSRKGSCDMEPDKCGHGRIINGAFVTETKTVEYSGEFCDMNDADAKLCARSRTLLPEMADEIERLEGELKALKSNIREIAGGGIVYLEECHNEMPYSSYSTLRDVFDAIAAKTETEALAAMKEDAHG